MSSKFGFVYILINDYMPGVYKVGCTERSPHERASELSSHTSVPAPFEVLCYIEIDDFQAWERRVHEWLSEHRISSGREFFKGGLEFAVRCLYWNRSRTAFVIPSRWDEAGAEEWLLNLCFGKGADGYLRFWSLSDTTDPWTPRPKPAEPVPTTGTPDASATAAVVKVVGEAIARIETGEQPNSDDGEPF